MQNTFMLSPYAVLILDAEGHVDNANPAALALFGATAPELIGRPFLELVAHPTTRIAHAIHEDGLADSPFRATVRLHRAEGEATAELTMTSAAAPGAKPTIVCYLHDITELTAHEQRRARLLRLEQKARLAAEEAQKRVGILARMGELTHSLDFEETLGRIAGLAVEGFATHCVVYLREEDGTVRIGAQGFAEPEVHTSPLITESYPVPGGSVMATALDTGEPVLISGGDLRIDEILGLGGEHSAALRDISPSSAMLLPMRARGTVHGAIVYLSCGETGAPFGTDDLRFAESLAQSAAFAIDNARLYQTARDAITARQELLAVVAHDLRSPLGAISVSTELLLDRSLEENWRRHHLDIIQQASSRMSRLIQDLLDIARIERDQLHIDVAPQEIPVLLTEAHSLFTTRGWSKGIDISFVVPDRISRVIADRYRIQQVLTNLLDNAVKFTRPGGRVRMTAQESNGHVHLTVWNSGPPIRREDMEHIFERFWRSGDDGTGAGLGLSIVKAIVESHGGQISAESSPTEGTSFTFTLPIEHERRRVAAGW